MKINGHCKKTFFELLINNNQKNNLPKYFQEDYLENAI